MDEAVGRGDLNTTKNQERVSVKLEEEGDERRRHERCDDVWRLDLDRLRFLGSDLLEQEDELLWHVPLQR